MEEGAPARGSPSQPAPDARTQPATSTFFIPFNAALTLLPARVLKQGETFAVFNPHGDLVTYQRPDEGLFHQDTRFLSHYQLRIGGALPVLLGSSVRRDVSLFTADLTNPDFADGGAGRTLPKDRVHISRVKFLWQGTCHERIKVQNFGPDLVDLLLQLTFDSDFADIFEARGRRRRRHGAKQRAVVNEDSVTLAYQGLDDVRRAVRIYFDPAPYEISPSSASHVVSLGSGESWTLYVAISCELDRKGRRRHFVTCLREARRAMRRRRRDTALVYTSNELFNEWINRSLSDLYALVTETEHGPYPYAGIPWFSTPFGRDGIITALQVLWMDPTLARGVLAFLANTQAVECNAQQEAEPGKIVHEMRKGEMAALGEIPFAQYYGSVDATPLFVMLAGRYFERTGDLEFIKSIWSNIEAALAWIDKYGDRDGDGFVEYLCGTPTGLRNQGWKDSDDSVFHENGRLATGAIALCEVQGYVYEAKIAAANMAAAMGKAVEAETWLTEADLLRERFQTAYWCEELSTYALALNGDKRLCRVRTSNAGQTLFTGIADGEHARKIADQLLSADFYTGWGIRTVAANEKRYNPMSYHNGSVWPHDNALIALGFARYGFKSELVKLLGGMFDASIFMEAHRLPELFCGFPRATVENPVRYPVACVPQAWSSATVLALLAASLGISFDVKAAQIHVRQPVLPEFLDTVELRNLTVGDASVDLLCQRYGRDVSVVSTDRRGHVEIVVSS